MDWQLIANQNGHIACTHGGETLAGLVAAKKGGLVEPHEIAIINSTAHALKFADFQDMYYQDRFPSEFKIKPDPDLKNAPVLIRPKDLEAVPMPGKPLKDDAFQKFVDRISNEIAQILELK